MLSAFIELENEFCEWTTTTVHAHSVPDLYHEIAERCNEFASTTYGQIIKIRIGEIVVDDPDDGYN